MGGSRHKFRRLKHQVSYLRKSPICQPERLTPQVQKYLTIYASDYLVSPEAASLSHSLPLRQDAYSAAQAKPYFADKLVETLIPALQASGHELEAPYIADEMEEDIASRVEVLKQLS